eukprot:gene6449-11894_t
MANNFKSLPIKRFPKLSTKQNPEDKFWHKFQFPVIVKEYSAINQIDFCEAPPKDFLVTCSGKIQIFSSTTSQLKRTITRFKSSACCGKFRKDGKLIVSGFEDGGVKVFDSSSRTVLRQFRPHSKATHVAGFLPNTSQVYSASDDCTVKCLDIPTQKEDYIRSGESCLSNNNVLITGAYDHTVKLWDLRAGESTFSVNHGDPVESVLLYPNCGMCISSGGNFVKVWDILAGGKMLFSFSNHQKTVTCLCFDGSHTRLLSGSIDRHVKVYNTDDYSVVASLEYPSAVTSIGLSTSGSHLVAGMADGSISIKERKKPKQLDIPSKEQTAIKRGSRRYFERGQNDRPQEGDFVVEEKRYRKENRVDKLLRRFEYRAVLDTVLASKGNQEQVVSLLIELARRDGLKIALSNRDADEIVPIMKFIIRNICKPQYSRILINIAGLILDIYTPVMGQSEQADQLFEELREKLAMELEYQKEAFAILGALETIIAASKINVNAGETLEA